MRGKNSVIFSGEKIIIADCSAQSTATDSRLNSVKFLLQLFDPLMSCKALERLQPLIQPILSQIIDPCFYFPERFSDFSC